MTQSLHFNGSAEITGEGIRKHFKNYDPWRAIFELIWNGLDARATKVNIRVIRNDLDGLELVTVLDNGKGIDFNNWKDNFGKFNDSSKKQSAEQHGSHGRGRLAFHRLAHDATWYTRHLGADGKISITSADIKNFAGIRLDASQQHALIYVMESGTCVELKNFHNSLPDDDDLIKKLSIEFGWRLVLNHDISIDLNGRPVPIPPHELTEQPFVIEQYPFVVKAIRWDQAPSSEKSYNYLLSADNKVIARELSSFNKKPNFYVSIFISSPWTEILDAEEQEFLRPTGSIYSSVVWRSLSSSLKEFTQAVYEEFLKKYVDRQMLMFEDEGIFPDYPNDHQIYAEWKRRHTKSLVRNIYLADPSVFTNLKKKQRKIIVRLLDKLAVSNENDSLFEVLEGVLELDDTSMEVFAEQLKKTRLENIISTIELLQKRELAVRKLKALIDNHFKVVLETPDLQRIIENNTWLFGPAYEILGAEEDTFLCIAKRLRDSVRDINSISNEDLEGDTDMEGANRQTDLFMARKQLSFDSRGQQFFKCVIIEIKRPSVALNYKHLRQLDDYAAILNKHPEFNSAKMQFELILVGRKISDRDYEIGSRMEGLKEKGEAGLVGADSKIKRYVKTWNTIFDEFSLSNNYLLDTLKTQRESLSEQSAKILVESLQSTNTQAA